MSPIWLRCLHQQHQFSPGVYLVWGLAETCIGSIESLAVCKSGECRTRENTLSSSSGCADSQPHFQPKRPHAHSQLFSADSFAIYADRGLTRHRQPGTCQNSNAHTNVCPYLCQVIHNVIDTQMGRSSVQHHRASSSNFWSMVRLEA